MSKNVLVFDLVVALTGAYFLFKKRNYPECAPNKAQEEFIRLAAQNHYYFGLGDIGHADIACRLFALHRRTVAALGEAGKKNYYLEVSPSAQPYWNDLQRETPTASKNPLKEKFEKFSERINLWMGWGGLEGRRRIIETFETAATNNKRIKFKGADLRVNGIWSYPSFMVGFPLGLANVLLTILATYGYAAFHNGEVSDAAREKIERFLMPGGAAGPMSNDKKLAQFILSDKKPAGIMYGSGHFRRSYEPAGRKTSIRSIIEENGKSLCVVDICRERPNRALFDKLMEPTLPDARLYITPPPDCPSGIEILNPALQPLYEQALINAGMAKTDQGLNRDQLS